MAITVKHTKVSTIPDGDDTSVVRPSDWNADHQLVGTVPVDNGGTGASTLTGYVKGNGTSAMTASSTIPNTDITGLGTASTKDAGIANGVATLDSSGQVPLSQIPPLGDLNYQGTWNATTNTPTLTSSVGTKGYYYVVSVAGTTNLNGITDWQINDWAVFNGSVWQKIDNTDAVTSVNGYTGTVVLTNTDISGFGTMSTQNANAVAITGGSINGTTIGASTQADITGNTISAYTKFVAQDYYAQSVLGGNLRTSGGTSLLNWDGGGSGNVTVNGGLVVDPANKNINMSPTGTGSVTIAPATTGAMDNMVIGATTPKAITGTTVTATTFSGSGASLTSIPNSALVNSAITINGNSTALGGSVSVGTVTSVTGTSPVVSSGGNTPAISMPAATTSVSGYLTSTDWNTFNNKGSGTVTSVSGTAGRITSTGGNTPVIDLASGIATAGTTGSSTLIPVVTIDTYGRVTSITTASNPQGTVTSVAALTLGTTGTDLSSSVATGTTTPVITLNVPTASATNRGALSAADWTTFNNKQPSGTYINSVSGTTNQITASTTTGAVTISLPSSVTTGQFIANQTVSGSSTKGAFAYGTLGYSDSNHLATFQTAVNAYAQVEIQNTQAGTTASADMVVGNDLTTASTYYGDFGINSSLFSGTGSLGLANAVYLTATTGDLSLGTTTSNAIHFVIGGSATDAMTISTAGLVTANSFASSSAAITGGSVNSTPVGATTASTGAFTTLSASSTVSGTGFSTYLASPPAIGGTAAAAITGTTITATKFVGVSGGTF